MESEQCPSSTPMSSHLRQVALLVLDCKILGELDFLVSGNRDRISSLNKPSLAPGISALVQVHENVRWFNELGVLTGRVSAQRAVVLLVVL